MSIEKCKVSDTFRVLFRHPSEDEKGTKHDHNIDNIDQDGQTRLKKLSQNGPTIVKKGLNMPQQAMKTQQAEQTHHRKQAQQAQQGE